MKPRLGETHRRSCDRGVAGQENMTMVTPGFVRIDSKGCHGWQLSQVLMHDRLDASPAAAVNHACLEASVQQDVVDENLEYLGGFNDVLPMQVE